VSLQETGATLALSLGASQPAYRGAHRVASVLTDRKARLMKLSNPGTVAQFLATSPAWQHNSDRGGLLVREFGFSTFAEAFGFMTQVALAAERLNHHPEWSNVYNQVRIALTTHDADGVTDLDLAMAGHIDAAYAAYAAMSQPHPSEARRAA